MKNKLLVEKILKCVTKLLEYTENVDYEAFESNTMLVEACVFNLSQIGEYANKIDKDFEKAYDGIPWRVLYGLRNKIVHDYEGVNLVLIWEILKDDLPFLKEQLLKLYLELK